MRRPLPIALLLGAAVVCGRPALAQDGATPETIAYVDDPHPEQVLDLWWPDSPPASTVLFVHGGSLWESQERRTSPVYRDVCRPFLAAGFACASTDYRLAPAFQWPAMPLDVAAAVAKVREIVADRGAEPDRLVLFGHSSGCHLAAILGANPVYLEAVGLTPADLAGLVLMGCTLDRYDAALRGATADRIREGFRRDSSEVARFGSAENWIASNPAHHLGPHVPPTLVVLGEKERFFPPILEQGARFVRRLREADVPAEIAVFPGTHRRVVENLDEPGNPVFEAISAYVEDPAAAVGGDRR
ncbi:MAG: alpha/beta hydrolase [Gemmatimonadota bacterium]|nr:alpha/beta hydrolase [Gemmatimonadota bacterium]